jgi:hypothetical protein
MDVQAIRQVCLTTATGVTGLRSLQFQNHLYGCFIVMEDIAQGTVELSGTVLRTPTFSFDLEARFDEIGLHYGFIMDTQLRWGVPEEYRRCWVEAFQATGREKKIETVDGMEDVLIELVTLHIPAESSFFSHALHTGVLPHEWIDKALLLLSPALAAPTASAASAVASTTSDPEETSTVWNHANIEKTSLKRRLRFTRRVRPLVPKKHLGLTRRH